MAISLPDSEIARIVREPYRYLVPELLRRTIFFPQSAAVQASGVYAGNAAVTKIYVGTGVVPRVYAGAELIWGS